MATVDARQSRALIAIETSTAVGSVALAREQGGRLVCEALAESGQEPSRRVLAMVESLLAGAGLAASSLDAIAFDAGPGSFTGIRIGVGVAQGIGFAVSVPLIGVSSLEILATAALAGAAARADRAAPAPARLVLAAIDARMGQVYCGVFRQAGARARLVDAIAVCDPLEAVARFERALQAGAGGARALAGIAAGDAFTVHAPLGEWVESEPLERATVGAPDAATLARIAMAKLGAGETVAASDAAPIYVRDKVALDVREQRALRAGATR